MVEEKFYESSSDANDVAFLDIEPLVQPCHGPANLRLERPPAQRTWGPSPHRGVIGDQPTVGLHYVNRHYYITVPTWRLRVYN